MPTQPLLSPRALPLLALAFALACGGGTEAPEKPAAPPPAPPAAKVEPAASQVAPPAIPEADARAFVERWVAVQNAGDFAGYGALYDAHFRGVKRSGPRVRNYDQKGWLADRGGMFKRPMQVKAEDVSVTTSAKTAVVQFQQDWASGSYHDRGPKRMVLVHGAGGIRIASEELLASEQFVSGDTQARLVVSATKGPSYVLVARAKDVKHAPEPVFAEAAYPALSVFALPDGAKLPELEPFLNGKVRLIGSQGACEASVVAPRLVRVAYEHFGTIQQWRGEVPEQPSKASASEIAQGMLELSPDAYLAVELDAACTASPELALPASAGPKTPVPARKVDSDMQVLSRRAFGKLPFVAKMNAEEREELLAGVAFSGFGASELEWLALGSVTSCGIGVQGFALFRVRGKELELVLDSDRSELLWLEALVDLDGDEKPELVGTGSYGTPGLIVDVTGRTLHKLAIPYFDCPC